MMQHKEYMGEVWVDDEAGVIRGRVIGTRDVITFQGPTVEDARREFIESVEDYLELCTERGEEPERPFSGKFMVRIDPTLHRRLTLAAQRSGVSLNALVTNQLSGAIDAGAYGSSTGRIVQLPKRPRRLNLPADSVSGKKPRTARERASDVKKRYDATGSKKLNARTGSNSPTAEKTKEVV